MRSLALILVAFSLGAALTAAAFLLWPGDSDDERERVESVAAFMACDETHTSGRCDTVADGEKIAPQLWRFRLVESATCYLVPDEGDVTVGACEGRPRRR